MRPRSPNSVSSASILPTACLLTAATLAQQPPPSTNHLSIQISVNRVNVSVIVTDPQGNFIPNLARENFHIFDNGVEQPITDFANVISPAEVLLLVEAGPAVYFLASTHVNASHSFLDGLSSGDRIAVAKYERRSATPSLDFTADKSAAYAALSNVRYYVGFGSLNLSKSLNSILDSLAKTQGKKSIVLLSTGFDTSAPAEIDAALTRLKISDVRLLAISLSAAMRAPAQQPTKEKNKKKKDKQTDEEEAQKTAAKAAFTQQGFEEADRLLRALTDATGGQVYFPNNPQDSRHHVRPNRPTHPPRIQPSLPLHPPTTAKSTPSKSASPRPTKPRHPHTPYPLAAPT